MFKEYGKVTQKGKVIQILIMKDKACEDFECENFRDMFIGNNAGPRLSELKKDGVVTAEYYENPNKYKGFLGYKRAKYKLTDEAKEFYSKIYNVKPLGFFGKILA